MLWEWANEPGVRANSINQEPIPWESHLSWYGKRLQSPATRFWILESAGEPVGQIRYDRDDEEGAAVISFSVAPEHRGKGYGTRLITATRDAACAELNVRKVTAITLISNPASYKAFLKTGFKKAGVAEVGGKDCYQFYWQPETEHEG